MVSPLDEILRKYQFQTLHAFERILKERSWKNLNGHLFIMYRLVRSQVCYVLFVPTCIVSVKSLRRDLRKQICVFLLPGVNRINGIVLTFLTFDRKERTWRHLRRSIALAIRRNVKI